MHLNILNYINLNSNYFKFIYQICNRKIRIIIKRNIYIYTTKRILIKKSKIIIYFIYNLHITYKIVICIASKAYNKVKNLLKNSVKAKNKFKNKYKKDVHQTICH